MIKTHKEALDYLSKNLATLDNSFVDYPQETLDILFMERFLDILAPSMSQDNADHLLSKEEDENYEEYMRDYLSHSIPTFYTDLNSVIANMLHEVQEDWMKEQLELS